MAIPEVATAGQFPLADRDFATTYRGRAHALHLHGYPGRMLLAGGSVVIEPGDLTLSPGGLRSGYDLAAAGRHWCVHFTAPRTAGETVALPLHTRLGGAADSARERLAHIAGLHARAADSAVARASAGLALQEFLLWLAERSMRPSALAAQSEAARAAAIIDAGFHEPLTVPAIAHAVGRSQSQLSRQFRARYGTTIPHRLLQRRVEHARFLLESTDLPIWRVAERSGIPDAHHFNKTVRRLLGESPSAIRRAALGTAPVDPDR